MKKNDFIPPLIIKFFERLNSKKYLYYYGNFDSFDNALVFSKKIIGGYDQPNILDVEIEAYQKVKNGEAKFCRDGVAFYEQDYNYELLSCILFAYASLGKLVVADFGGALGGVFYRHRYLLQNLNIDWNIVEQEQFVKYGKEHVDGISFYYSLDELLENKKVDFLLFSSVIQYLPEGEDFLYKCLRYNIQFVCLTDTPFFNCKSKSIVKMQHVPASIYKAEYPLHIFNYDNMKNEIMNLGYKYEMEWSKQGIPIKTLFSFKTTNYKGFLLEKQ